MSIEFVDALAQENAKHARRKEAARKIVKEQPQLGESPKNKKINQLQVK